MNLAAKSRLILVKEIPATRARIDAGVYARAGWGRQILVGAIRIDAPANAGGESKVRRQLPLVCDVCAFAPVLSSTAGKPEGGLFGKDGVAVAEDNTVGGVSVDWVSGARSRYAVAVAISEQTARTKLSKEANAEELCVSSTQNTVQAIPVFNVVSAFGPGAVIPELLV